MQFILMRLSILIVNDEFLVCFQQTCKIKKFESSEGQVLRNKKLISPFDNYCEEQQDFNIKGF